MKLLVSALLTLGFVASSGFADGRLEMESSVVFERVGSRDAECRTFKGPNGFVVVDDDTVLPTR